MANGTKSPPALLFWHKSPGTVYANNIQFIESTLKEANEKMTARFKKCQDLYASKVYEVLIKTKGIRMREAQNNSMEAYRGLVKRLILEETKTAPGGGGGVVDETTTAKPKTSTDQVVDNIKAEIKVIELAKDKDGDPAGYFPIGDRMLMSLSEFLSGMDDWNSTKGKVKLPGVKVSYALGYEPSVVEASNLASDVYNLDRLLRTFRGTFVLTRGEHTHHFQKILVDVSSYFMENVILPQGRTKRIPIEGVCVFNLNQRPNNTTGSLVHFDESSTIYVELDLAFVLEAFGASASEALEVLTESKDDII